MSQPILVKDLQQSSIYNKVSKEKHSKLEFNETYTEHLFRHKDSEFLIRIRVDSDVEGIYIYHQDVSIADVLYHKQDNINVNCFEDIHKLLTSKYIHSPDSYNYSLVGYDEELDICYVYDAEGMMRSWPPSKLIPSIFESYNCKDSYGWSSNFELKAIAAPTGRLTKYLYIFEDAVISVDSQTHTNSIIPLLYDGAWVEYIQEEMIESAYKIIEAHDEYSTKLVSERI